MFLHLPVELIDAICQRVPSNDLASLARTNSLLNTIAQRILLKHISLSSNTSHLFLVLTLSARPDLAHHVRQFSFRLQSSLVFDSFHHHLRRALSLMTQLDSLELFLDPSASWVLPTSVAYPRLLHLASSFHLDGHVADFLINTNNLLELELDGSHSNPSPIPPTSVPRLSQFVGSSHAANAIVPGRPVETIHLSLGNLSKEDVTLLAKSTAPVVIFGATTSSPPIPLLKTLCQQMPHLVYLRIMTTFSFTQPPEPSFYQEIAELLTSLPDLKGFELGGMHWGPPEKTAPEKGSVWPSQSLIGDIASEQEVESDSELFYVY